MVCYCPSVKVGLFSLDEPIWRYFLTLRNDWTTVWLGLDTSGRVVAISAKGDIFWDFLSALLYAYSLLRRVYSVRKEFAPLGSKFFPYRADPFSETNNFDRVVAPESALLLLKSATFPFFRIKFIRKKYNSGQKNIVLHVFLPPITP